MESTRNFTLSMSLTEGEQLLDLLFKEMQSGNVQKYAPIFCTMYLQMRQRDGAQGTKYQLFRVRPYIIMWLQHVFEEFQHTINSRFTRYDDSGSHRLYLLLRTRMDQFGVNWSDFGVSEGAADYYLNWRRHYLKRIKSNYGIETLIDRSAIIDHTDFPELYSEATVVMK